VTRVGVCVCVCANVVVLRSTDLSTTLILLLPRRVMSFLLLASSFSPLARRETSPLTSHAHHPLASSKGADGRNRSRRTTPLRTGDTYMPN
jgi:hypothetical protein